MIHLLHFTHVSCVAFCACFICVAFCACAQKRGMQPQCILQCRSIAIQELISIASAAHDKTRDEPTIETEMSQAYLAATLRDLASKVDMVDANQQDLTAFRVTLPNALAEYAPASGQILGILKQTGGEV